MRLRLALEIGLLLGKFDSPKHKYHCEIDS